MEPMLKTSLTSLALFTIVLAAAVTHNFGQQVNVDEAAKQVDTYLSTWDKKDMPGCAVGVVKDGKLIYKRGVGLANLSYDVPNTPTTLFEVASTTKPFTAMSIALLAEQGKLSIDDDI